MSMRKQSKQKNSNLDRRTQRRWKNTGPVAWYLGSIAQRLMVATLETALELALSKPAWREEATRDQLGEENKSWGGEGGLHDNFALKLLLL